MAIQTNVTQDVGGAIEAESPATRVTQLVAAIIHTTELFSAVTQNVGAAIEAESPATRVTQLVGAAIYPFAPSSMASPCRAYLVG